MYLLTLPLLPLAFNLVFHLQLLIAPLFCDTLQELFPWQDRSKHLLPLIVLPTQNVIPPKSS